MEPREAGHARLKDLADTAGRKVSETAMAATQRSAQVAHDARDKAKIVAQSGEELAEKAGRMLARHAEGVKGDATETVDKVKTKKPDPYEQAITEFNGAFTAMNDKGLSLLRQRERSTDLIELIELLVNSIANTPKTFETTFEEIEVHRAQFLATQEFARRDLEAARKSAAGAGAGFAAGAAVASMAPTAAMWVATTFGAASTGTAISTLSGAAATNAALAWLGGGALAAGGGGTAAGGALLALAGPVGWTIAGATLLASIALFTMKTVKNREEKHAALTALKKNTAIVKGIDAQIGSLLERTTSLRQLLMKSYGEALQFFGADFAALPAPQQAQLGALVNNTKACAALLTKRIEQDADGE